MKRLILMKILINLALAMAMTTFLTMAFSASTFSIGIMYGIKGIFSGLALVVNIFGLEDDE